MKTRPALSVDSFPKGNKLLYNLNAISDEVGNVSSTQASKIPQGFRSPQEVFHSLAYS